MLEEAWLLIRILTTKWFSVTKELKNMKIKIDVKYRISGIERDVFIMLQTKKYHIWPSPLSNDTTIFYGTNFVNVHRMGKYWPDLTATKAYNCNEN